MNTVRICLIAIALAQASRGAPPDFTSGAPPPDPKAHDWTLGPTGLRGWLFTEKMESTAARQIYVTRVATGSPAAAFFTVGDVILGTNDRTFTNDARVTFGQSVTAAEAGDGKLHLLRWRAGKSSSVTVELERLGAYSPTAPYDCPKSARIFETGCRRLAARLQPLPPDKRGNPIVRSLNSLALLASGNTNYLPLVREEARWAAGFSASDKGLPTWWYGYVTLFLAEYQLATQDPETLPGLQRLALAIARGQSAVGSWGHGFASDGGRLGGYGAMNQPGLSLTMGMILAHEAGVSDPVLDAAILKSRRFLSFYIGKGCIPYGDHHPWLQTHDDNGKCGAGAVMFDLLGDRPGAEFFSRMSTASYGTERDTGHTGNFFNLLWALPGVSRSGPFATGAWMQESAWYFDLARCWDGSFVYQGEPMEFEDNKYKGWDSTGAYLLSYALPYRKIYLTGRKPSAAPRLTSRQAAELIEDGRGWSPARKAYGYEGRTVPQLLAGLTNWSPVVRERNADALAKQAGDPVPHLLQLLGGASPEGRLGACSALSALGKRAAPAVPALRQVLWDEDLWLRIQAGRALANIGDAGRSAAPDLLKMLASRQEGDPRGMVQRYVTFSLFYSGNVLDVRGMLAKSLDGIDRRLLYPAIEVALQNEDGRARSALESVFDRLKFEDLKPLWPAIHRAIVEPAPSGEMFADGIRIRGLQLFAKYRIAEGVPLCTQLIEHSRWGEGRRIEQLLPILRSYGGHAKSQLPALRELETALSAPRANGRDRLEEVRKTIAFIESAPVGEPLRSLREVAQ